MRQIKTDSIWDHASETYKHKTQAGPQAANAPPVNLTVAKFWSRKKNSGRQQKEKKGQDQIERCNINIQAVSLSPVIG